MRNHITEGRGRELPPDEHGEVVRVPTPATVELRSEILLASGAKESGQGDAGRARSSIESRSDLRLAAENEALQSDPPMLSASLAIDADTARRWADLDAGDFGRIRSANRREAALDAIAGHMRVSVEYAQAMGSRSPVLAASARVLNEERAVAARRMALPSIERNADALAQVASAGDLTTVDPQDLAREDARSLAVLAEGSADRRLAAAVVGENARNHRAYRDELRAFAPPLAREVLAARLERDALQAIERRRDALPPSAHDAMTVAEAREAVREDLASFSLIKDAGVRFQAAVAIGDNARTQANYRALLQLRSPGIASEVQSASAENERRAAEKDDRKAEDFAAMQRTMAERAVAWSPEQAVENVRADLAYFREATATERHAAISDMIVRADRNPVYAQTLSREAPDVAREVEVRSEREAAERAATERHRETVAANAQSRAAVIDAAALARVANIRARETARVVEQLALPPDDASRPLRDARQAMKSPPLDGRVTAPDDPDIELQRHRAIKRPVAEQELSEALRVRFVVSHGKRGLLDKGSTEFVFREGVEQGRVAFVDAGKSMRTEREDRATIRAMIEVATAKHWQEITVSGTEDFRRNAWLEAALHGIKARGYEPREADRRLLAELRQEEKRPRNTIAAVEREIRRDLASGQLHEGAGKQAESILERKHIDGDALTAHEKSVLDHSRAMLIDKAFGERFTQATLRELEAKLRGERVYVGEIVEHGAAPYQFDQDNDENYYVTLRTRAGEQVIWGKGLAEAMEDRRVGEQVVLQNIGKREVMVQERVRDAEGRVIGLRPKESHLNAWKSELLSRFSDKARAEFAHRATARRPGFGVYDTKAPRPASRQDAVGRAPELPRTAESQRHAEQQRNARER